MSEKPDVKPGTAKPRDRFARADRFRYYIHDRVAVCRLQLLGQLTEADLPDLNGCWLTARTILGKRPLVLDLHGLASVDEAGKQWLAGVMQEGATCSPEGFLRELVAGRHAADSAPSASSSKPGLFGKIAGIVRGVNIEPVK